jgi:hypothetical protein
MKRHDPEADAAGYLAGATTRRARRRFETHILECEACWNEVQLGRTGRQLAESGRELAPQPLRDRVRGAISLLPTPRIPFRRKVALATVVAMVAVGAGAGVFQLTRPDQPELIQTLIGHFEAGEPRGRPAVPQYADRLGDLRLVVAETIYVHGVRIGAHRYRDSAGHQVVLYRASRTFPMAVGAERDGTRWEATADGTVLLCADRPAPSLLAGDDRAEVRLAARVLGLS